MKKIYTLLFTITPFLGLNQTFEFKMYFEDSVGNKDTLTMGYDPTASDSIDANFGEINIINIPLDSVFDVRISDEFNLGLGVDNQTFHTKKNIVYNNSCSNINVITLNIKANNWPVTATWDSTLFNNSCLDGSVFNSMLNWFDVSGGSDLLVEFLMLKDSVVFSSNNIIGHSAFVNSNNDTISVFEIILSNPDYMSSVKENNFSSLTVYPNPFTNTLNFTFENNINGKIMIYDVSGQLIYSENIQNKNLFTLNTTNLNNGVFFYQVIDVSTGTNLKSGKLIRK